MLRGNHIQEGESKRRKLRRRGIWLIYSLHENEYRIFESIDTIKTKGLK
jgi:hypothetical protein